MANWVVLIHDECKLPRRPELEELHAKYGSIVKCGDSAPGCGRAWRLDSAGRDRFDQPSLKWSEVTQKNGSWIETGGEQPVEEGYPPKRTRR